MYNSFPDEIQILYILKISTDRILVKCPNLFPYVVVKIRDGLLCLSTTGIVQLISPHMG